MGTFSPHKKKVIDDGRKEKVAERTSQAHLCTAIAYSKNYKNNFNLELLVSDDLRPQSGELQNISSKTTLYFVHGGVSSYLVAVVSALST